MQNLPIVHYESADAFFFAHRAKLSRDIRYRSGLKVIVPLNFHIYLTFVPFKYHDYLKFLSSFAFIVCKDFQ